MEEFRERRTSFSLKIRAIRPSAVFGTRRRTALRREGFAWVPDLGSFLKLREVGVTPQTRGSVDYLSTHGIQVVVGLPDATSENRAESPLYRELYPSTMPAYTCPKQYNIIPT